VEDALRNVREVIEPENEVMIERAETLPESDGDGDIGIERIAITPPAAQSTSNRARNTRRRSTSRGRAIVLARLELRTTLSCSNAIRDSRRIDSHARCGKAWNHRFYAASTSIGANAIVDGTGASSPFSRNG
jgi:hypothetical protein